LFLSFHSAASLLAPEFHNTRQMAENAAQLNYGFERLLGTLNFTEI
jgi:hypothetical protein